MQQFITIPIKEKFSRITLDYTFATERTFGEITKWNISSKSTLSHFKLLLEMGNKELIPSDEILREYLHQGNYYAANNRVAALGDMIFQLSNGDSILYCPKILQEYQKLRLRLWHEYLELAKRKYEICFSETTKISKEGIPEFLKEEQILEDDYIRHLIKKFPNYEERMIYG